MTVHVSLGFAKLNDKELLPFATGVVLGLTGNPDFTTPTVTALVLEGHRKIFEDALAKANKGSVADTLAKETARAVLLDDLRQNAIYVESHAGGDEAKILSTGYLPMKHGHSPVANMPKAQILGIINSATTQLLVRVQAIANAHSYEAQVQIGTGPWQIVVTSSQARGLLIEGLIPGTTYNVRVRAVGANRSYGEWSDTVVHICT